ncbi:MAG: hypothetical protein FWD60_09905 [Candidatus Azobacteroides sp.]|nr:hypothetical protein [Candidatus Azobacteroides sp.]
MSTGYQISEQEELHYVTFQIIRWIDIFTRRVYRDIVIDSLRFCQQNKGLEVYGLRCKILCLEKKDYLSNFLYTLVYVQRIVTLCTSQVDRRIMSLSRSVLIPIDIA